MKTLALMGIGLLITICGACSVVQDIFGPETARPVESVPSMSGTVSVTPPMLLTLTPSPEFTPTVWLGPLTPSPFPTLRPAPETISGKVEIPPGKYLFVEFWHHDQPYGTAEACGWLTGDGPGDYMYWGAEDNTEGPTPRLEIMVDYIDDFDGGLQTVQGFYGVGGSMGGPLWSGMGKILRPIHVFPVQYESQGGERSFVIHNVDAQGVIVAEIMGERVVIEPGQQWGRNAVTREWPGCRVITTYTFTNAGLLDASQIYLKRSES